MSKCMRIPEASELSNMNVVYIAYLNETCTASTCQNILDCFTKYFPIMEIERCLKKAPTYWTQGCVLQTTKGDLCNQIVQIFNSRRLYLYRCQENQLDEILACYTLYFPKLDTFSSYQSVVVRNILDLEFGNDVTEVFYNSDFRHRLQVNYEMSMSHHMETSNHLRFSLSHSSVEIPVSSWPQPVSKNTELQCVKTYWENTQWVSNGVCAVCGRTKCNSEKLTYINFKLLLSGTSYQLCLCHVKH